MDKQNKLQFTKILYLKDKLYEVFMIEAMILELGEIRSKGAREFREILIGDETGMINLIVKGEEIHFVKPMDIILIDRAYAFPDRYGNGLKLCYGENGRIQKIGEFCQGVSLEVNLSIGDAMVPSEVREDFTADVKCDNICEN